MAIKHSIARRCTGCRSARRGLVSLEVVMTTAVMLPIAAAILFLGFKLAAVAYQVLGGLVAWPFL